MTEALVPLVVALITLLGVGFTAIVTWSISQRRIAADHITAERAKWRERIRAQALLVHDAILFDDATALLRLKGEFRALLNPFDPEDRKILNGMKLVKPPKEREEEADRFARQISLLLKHDWDRAKLEAGFFLGRWILTVKRWDLGWACGRRGKRRELGGLRWYEKYKIRPVITSVLIVLLGFSLLTLLVGGGKATGGLAREPDVTPEEVGLSSERLARFADYARAMVHAGKIPGATIAVSRFGKLAYFETIGWADIEERKPTRMDTLYRLHSMTKPLFSVATLTLVEEGRLSLQDPISKYVPEFADVKVLVGGTADAPELADPPSAPKLGRLLSQTAGIATGGDLFAERTIAEIYSRASIHEGNPTAEEVAQRIARLPLAGHPGEVFVYGLSFDVLARVLEVASGQPLDDFIAERVLDPLGMEDTFFAVPEDKLHRFSNSYDITGPGSLQAVTRADHMARWQPGRRFLSPNGGLVSTVSDYLRFAQMMLGGGELDGARIVSRKTIDLITATVVGNAELGLIRAALPGYGYSLGFGVLENVAESGKPGSLGQYEWAGWGDTYFFVDPKEQLIGLFFTQVYPGGTYGLRESLTSFTYQALID